MRWFESSRPSWVRASREPLAVLAALRAAALRGTVPMIPPALQAMLEAFASGDLASAVDCFAENAEYREPKKEPVRGREAIARWFDAFQSSGIRWRFEHDETLVDGARACVVYRFAMAGGEGEPWRERAGCATVRFDADGKIAEWREYSG